MNKLWIWFLFKVDGWMCERLARAYLREKVRAYKRELERQHGQRN